MIVSSEMALRAWHPLTQNGPGVNINVDPSRIAYGVMTGIGFLGAGVIVQQKGAVRGLTTAAGLWCMAAVGLAAGFGMYALSILTTTLVLFSLWVLEYFSRFLPKVRYRTVTIRTAWGPACVPNAVHKFKSGGMNVIEAYFDRDADPKYADIHLRVSFFNAGKYYAFERQIEAEQDYQLMASREL
jgi:uncharacterized membrane protein YhiD involved in acid resistance